MLLSPVHGLYEAEYNRVIIEDPTRHSVCPELVVMDVAEQHESYEGNDMGSIEDLQTPATLLTPGLHRCSLCSLRVGTGLSQLHCTNDLSKIFYFWNDEEPNLTSGQYMLALECMRSQPDLAHLKVIAANV